MVQEQLKLFSNRQSAGSFLIAGKKASRNKAQKARQNAAQALLEYYPDLPSGEAFFSQAQDQLKKVSRFLALGVRPDAARGGDQPAVISPQDLLAAARAMEALSKTQGGFWGLGEDDILIWVIPNQGLEQGEAAWEMIRQKLKEEGRTASAGLCAFPQIDFTRAEVLENTEKALDTAWYYGPDSQAPLDAVALNVSADKYYAEGDLEAAVAELRRALLVDPNDMNVLNSLGVCLTTSEKYDEAFDCFEKAHQADPDDVMPLYNMGLCRMLAEDWQSAMDYFDRALEQGPDTYEALVQGGLAAQKLGLSDKAQQLLERAVDAQPKSWPGRRHLGDLYFNQGQFMEAAKQYEQAVKAHPGDAAGFSALAEIYAARLEQNLEIALSFARQAVELEPENGLHRQRLGTALEKRKKYGPAKEQYEKARDMGQDVKEHMVRVEKLLAAQ